MDDGGDGAGCLLRGGEGGGSGDVGGAEADRDGEGGVAACAVVDEGGWRCGGGFSDDGLAGGEAVLADEESGWVEGGWGGGGLR